MKLDNPILLSDSKSLSVSQRLTEHDRKVRVSFILKTGKPTILYGLRSILEPIFTPITSEMIEEANEVFGDKRTLMTGMWERMVERYEGRIPLNIVAPEEGTIINNGSLVISLESEGTEFNWIPVYFADLIHASLESLLNYGSALLEAKMVLRDFGETSTAKNIELTKLFMHSDMYSPNIEMGAARGALFRVLFPIEASPPGTMLLRRYYDGAPPIFPAIHASSQDSIDKPMINHFLELISFTENRILIYSFTNYDFDSLIDIVTEMIKPELRTRRYPLILDYSDASKEDLILFAHMLSMTFGYVENEMGYKRIASDIYISTDIESIDELKAFCDALRGAKWGIESFSFVIKNKAFSGSSLKLERAFEADPTSDLDYGHHYVDGVLTSSATYSSMVTKLNAYIKKVYPQSKTGVFTPLPNRVVEAWVSSLDNHGVYTDD